MYNGILGGFSGRIGNIIGYMMNGSQYIRLAPNKRTGAATMAQLIQRKKFSTMTRFMSPVASFLNDVHKNKTRGKYSCNKLFSANHQEAVTGEYPWFTIDYRRFQLTAGTLPGPREMHVSCDPDAFMNFHWEDQSNRNSDAHPFDRLYLAIYDEEEKNWELIVNAALREDVFISVDMKNHRGNQVQVYTGFISADKRKVSNSQYLGGIKIL
jgi:Family of unknown function (DUF6266)